MTKKDAIKILVSMFQSDLIAQGYSDIEQIENDQDREMAKALRLNLRGIK